MPQEREQGCTQDRWAEDVRLELCAQIVTRGPLTVVCLLADSGVVDENIKAAKLLFDVLHCGVDGCIVICVELD